MPDTTPNTALTRQALRQTRASVALASLAMPRVDELRAAQERIMDEAEGFTKAWFTRRRIAARTGADALQQMGAAALSNPGTTIKILNAWQAGSMGRIAQDVGEWTGLCTTCFVGTLTAEAEAGRALISDCTNAAAPAIETLSDHAIPV